MFLLARLLFVVMVLLVSAKTEEELVQAMEVWQDG